MTQTLSVPALCGCASFLWSQCGSEFQCLSDTFALFSGGRREKKEDCTTPPRVIHLGIYLHLPLLQLAFAWASHKWRPEFWQLSIFSITGRFNPCRNIEITWTSQVTSAKKTKNHGAAVPWYGKSCITSEHRTASAKTLKQTPWSLHSFHPFRYSSSFKSSFINCLSNLYSSSQQPETFKTH